MDAVGGALVALVFLVLGLGGWSLASSWDRDRIREYIEQRGGRIMSIEWAPFGKGWFGEKNDRIYEVVYYDRDGNQHFATCKTSMWSGVYWTEDRITHHKAKWVDALPARNTPGDPLIVHMPKEDSDAVADELTRLREENQRLREQLARRGGAAPDDAKCPACGAVLAAGALRCPGCDLAVA